MPIFDPSSDLTDVCDLTQQVTLRRYDTLFDEIVFHALYRPLGRNASLQSGGEVNTEDARFHLPVAEVAAAPRHHDLILDTASRTWLIREVQLTVAYGTWACLCRLI